MKKLNNMLVILATLAIVALCVLNTHQVGEQAKQLAELQQYHQYDIVDIELNDTIVYQSLNQSIDEYISWRNDEIKWGKIIEEWKKIPVMSLRHILTYHGTGIPIDSVVSIYKNNINYYKAYEDGYLTPKIQESAPDTITEIRIGY